MAVLSYARILCFEVVAEIEECDCVVYLWPKAHESIFNDS